MEFRFRETLNRKKLLVFLTSMTVIFGIVSVFLGEFLLPFASAFYAMLIIAESGGKRIISCIISILFIAATVLLFISGIYSVALPAICVIGIILAFLFIRRASKGEIAFYVCAIFTVVLPVSTWLTVVSVLGTFEFSVFKKFLSASYSELRNAFIEMLTAPVANAAGELTQLVDEVYAANMFDSVARLFFAIIVIVAFLLTGLTLKCFSSLLYNCAERRRPVVYWRFSTTNLVAYFYCALFILTIFVSAADSVFATVVLNLFYIFLMVYAYIGFNFAASILAQRMGGILAMIVVFVAVLFFGVVGLEILSLFGVFFTHISNRVGKETEH